jgi:hypothetical protein
MTNTLTAIPMTAGDSVPIAIASWLACLAIVLVIGLLIVKVAKEIRGHPAALEVRAESADKFVTKSDCEKRHQALDAQLGFLNVQRVTDAKDAAGSRKGIYTEVEGVRKEMAEMERRLNRADEDRTTGLHARLNEILAEVSEMRGQMKAQS